MTKYLYVSNTYMTPLETIVKIVKRYLLLIWNLFLLLHIPDDRIMLKSGAALI